MCTFEKDDIQQSASEDEEIEDVEAIRNNEDFEQHNIGTECKNQNKKRTRQQLVCNVVILFL